MQGGFYETQLWFDGTKSGSICNHTATKRKTPLDEGVKSSSAGLAALGSGCAKPPLCRLEERVFVR